MSRNWLVLERVHAWLMGGVTSYDSGRSFGRMRKIEKGIIIIMIFYSSAVGYYSSIQDNDELLGETA